MKTIQTKVFTMPRVILTKEQRVFIVRSYFETKSFKEVARLFTLQFPATPSPSKSTIWYNVKKYEEHGTSLNRYKENAGRKRTGRSDENIDAVHEALQNNPEGLTCRVNGLGLPKLLLDVFLIS